MCPADGIHSVAALCTLRVSIITDDMLTNSITVRLENMSQEKFLSPLLALFVEGVATVLSTTKDAVFVFNFMGPEYYHLRWNNHIGDRFAAFTLHVRPGIKTSVDLRQ